MPNWIMAIGAVVSAVLLFVNFTVQKKQYFKSRFDDNFFNLMQSFEGKVQRLYYSEIRTKTENGKQVDYDDIHHGVNVFKKFSFMYLKKVNLNLPEEKKEAAFQEIKKTYHTTFNSLFQMLLFIYDYIMEHKNQISTNFYMDFFILNIPEYFKFIIALYKIYDPSCEFAVRLIKEVKIIKPLDFSNYIKTKETYDEFIAKVNA
jgi:hypothetical protein